MDTVTYPPRLVYDETVAEIRDGKSVYLTKMVVLNVVTEEEKELFREWKFLGESTELFHSEDQKSFFIYAGYSPEEESKNFFEFDSTSLELKKSLRVGYSLKHYKNKVFWTKEDNTVSYDIKSHKQEKIFYDIPNRTPISEYEFLTFQFSNLHYYNTKTNERKSLLSLTPIIPPGEVHANVHIVPSTKLVIIGIQIFGISSLSRSIDYRTILFSFQEKRVISTFKFKLSSKPYSIIGNKFVILYEIKEKDFLAIINLKGKVLKRIEVFQSFLTQCSDNSFLLVSAEESSKEFRLYDSELNLLLKKELPGFTNNPILCLNPTKEDKKKLGVTLNEAFKHKIPKDLVNEVLGFI